MSETRPHAMPNRAGPEPIVVVPYDADWPRLFERAAAAIRAALGELQVEIEHVGRTAIPGLNAKPIIDLHGYIPTFSDGFACIESLSELGYASLGEFGIEGRHYFRRRRAGVSTDHLHTFARAAQPRHEILFRDYLLGYPGVVREYAALKYALAERHRQERGAYTDGKSDFIADVLRRAALAR